MNDQKKPEQLDLWGNVIETAPSKPKTEKKGKAPKQHGHLPEKLGKAIRLPVPDFSDPNRRPTCLEADFPIAQINALSTLEGNAGKPIYQMSKWWARRRSSVFRSLLIAAATEAPDDPNEAAKKVWEHYYCNHQKAGSFKKLKVLDPFMGGGTTLVEGARLGMQMTGVDLNPVAWFVVKNELACSDPEQVRALFDEIERQVKPRIQPFYTTTCPRGHQGRWVDVTTGETADVDPIDLPPGERGRYRWEGPEVIYTFWAKHGPCQAKGCGHRTPIFKTPVIAEKKLSTAYMELVCPGCGTLFHAELGETRMAPGAERVVAEGTPFSELSQDYARLLSDYDKGRADDTLERAQTLKAMTTSEPGLCCPACQTFAGQRMMRILDEHAQRKTPAAQRKKKAFGLASKPVFMHLLIHPDWLKGASGFHGDEELGGWAGATPSATAAWFERRMKGLRLIEVRGKTLPPTLVLSDGSTVETGSGTVPRRAHFTCGSCGREANTLESVRPTGHTAQVSAYALQCHCPQCDAEGYTYGGRYFKQPDGHDLTRLIAAEKEWAARMEGDLAEYWPRTATNPYSENASDNDSRIQNMDRWNYDNWWKMFNSRQLLALSQLLKAMTESPETSWPLDVREQALGAFQQYLRNQNMFCFWDISRDCMAPHLSNPNYHPKNLVIENCVFNGLGRGNWNSNQANAMSGVEWAATPWECLLSPGPGTAKSQRIEIGDPIIAGNDIYCGSSTDLAMFGDNQFDLVITDPPFGNNLFYSDLSDFFYVWLRLPLRKLYMNLPEARYFDTERSHRSLEAVDNKAAHPDDRENFEKEPFIESRHLALTQKMTGDTTLIEKMPNPLFRPQPSSDFYSQTLSAVWTEAGLRLKEGGILAFTFHHSADTAWNDVLRALFDAGYVLMATYPIRSDESKGESGQFGSKTIEYDIIHVCRKRLDPPEPVSWARMRRWVKEETARLKELLEHTHGRSLPESDLRVILRGKALEFYSRHYGQVLKGDGDLLEVRDALLGINQLLDDLLDDGSRTGGLRPPDSAEPAGRLFLRLFMNRDAMDRDELHKTLRGTGITQGDLEARGWVRVLGRSVHPVPVSERFAYFTEPGRNRKVIRTDLDQAHFLMGAAYSGSSVKIDDELNNSNFRIKKSVDDLLKWMAEVDQDPVNRLAARTAAQLVFAWRNRKEIRGPVQLSLFETLEENEP